MEAAGLSLGAILIIVGIMAYYGVFKSVENIVDYGNAEINKLRDEQTLRHDEWYIENELSADDAAKADSSRAYFQARRANKVTKSRTATTKAKA